MKTHRFNFLGSQRSYWDFYFGYALEAAFICLIEAVLFWQLAGGMSTSPLLILSIAALFILFNAVHVILVEVLFHHSHNPGPPNHGLFGPGVSEGSCLTSA